MKITVIGCGNAFSKVNGNQSFLLEEDGRTLLIDVGTRVPLFTDITKIDDYYVSHSHADHVGGLEEVAFTTYDWGTRPTHYSGFKSRKAPRLIANEALMKDLWNESLKGGLKSMEGFDSTLETFFETVSIPPHGRFEWQGWSVNLIQQVHVMTGNHIMPTYGLLFKKEGHKSVYFTTDSQHCSPKQNEIFYKQADIIFQDCECIGVDMLFAEGQKVYKDDDGKIKAWPIASQDMEIMELMARGIESFNFERFKFSSGVHANYAQLAGYPSANSIRLPKEIKAKMWLSHYQDFVVNNKDYKGQDCNWEEESKLDGFLGLLHVGKVFEV